MNDLDKVIPILQQHRAIISGSLALKYLGILPAKREIKDIDIVFETQEDLDNFVILVPGLTKEILQDTGVARNYIETFFRLKLEDYEVKIDAFVKNKPINTMQMAGSSYQMEYYRNIVKAKVDILFDREDRNDETYKKHSQDLKYIFNL